VLQWVQTLLVYRCTSFVRGFGIARAATGQFHLCESLVWCIIGEIASIDVKACLQARCISVVVVNALLQYLSNVIIVLS